MKHIRLLAILSLLLALLPTGQARAEVVDPCEYGVQASGAVYQICLPTGDTAWNGDLVVYAHGYVAYNQPVAIPQDQLSFPDGTSIPAMMTGLGYAFATTSYRENGLAPLTGLEDVVDLVAIFKAAHPETQRVYLTGPSEGGWVTVLGIERHPDIFSAGLSLCAPIGDFNRQINYWGDFRVVFDYFFPGVIPGDAMYIPQEVIDNWEAVYLPAALDAVQANPTLLMQLLRVTGAAYALKNPATRLETVEDLLWYSVFATNDGREKLGGVPYDNLKRRYSGSGNNARLNRLVARYQADPAALEAMIPYQTSGLLTRPLITLHTLSDPVVPYFHQPLYLNKVKAAKSLALYGHIAVPRYGHCAFESNEALAGFAWMVYKATGQIPLDAQRVLPLESSRAAYLRWLADKGLK